jgi:hypothetical protein
MFCVSEAQAAIIRAAFEQRGELSAVVELRRLFPGLGNMRGLGSASAPSLVGNRSGPFVSDEVAAIVVIVATVIITSEVSWRASPAGQRDTA